MISLIANSGIQFHTEKFSIDLNDGKNKMHFHEWFDTNDIKLKLELAHFFTNDDIWVRKKDLATFGYLYNGNPTDKWEEISKGNEVIQIPENSGTCFSMSINKCKIENFENKWLPFPYFELNRHNDSVFGPINWCRIKLIPTGINANNKREYDIVIAFDTRTLYDDGSNEDLDRETPIFSNAFENSKNYTLCKNEFQLVDFCSEKFSCEWVNKYILKLVHKKDNVNSLNSPKFDYLASFIYLIKYIQQNCNLPEVKLHKDKNVQWCNVDMVVDIGNSKTSAVLFDEGDFTKVRALEIQDFSNPMMKYSEPFDMRLAFHKAKLGNFGIVNSNQFVYPSFIRLGVEANRLIYNTVNENTGQEKVTTFSSPKRYLWDKKQHKVEWEFVQSVGEERESIWINGISQQFNSDGSLNSDGNGGRSTSYSRSSLMTFAFLEILSQARMQINSFNYRDEIGNTDKPRKINRIIITCPTAMSKEEQITLRKCTEEAAIILDRYMSSTYNRSFDYKELAAKVKVIPSVKNLSNKEERIEWTYDEATCSQFVFLYAEIAKRYLNNTKEYFDLYGKVRSDLGSYDQKSLTIGSLDIGAGTTDLMICAYEYSNTGQTTLKPIPLFWESFYYAGDDLLKEFVHQFVIEGPHGGIKSKLVELGKEKTAQALLYDFFGENHNPMTFRDRQFRNDFNLQVSLPIALTYLELARQNVEFKDLTYSDIFSVGCQPNEKILLYFESHFGFSFKDLKWQYNANNANVIIAKTFEPLLQKVAGIMYAYGCDFVLLAGRPTSLKQVEDLFLKFYPVTPNRLITLNSYRVGKWYPFQDGNGYFQNQKSIVAVGAMIGNITSTQGGMSGFSLDLSVLKEKLLPTTEYFGLMNRQTKRVEKAIISPSIATATVNISSLPVSLGCRQLDTESYPTREFYLLEFNNENIQRKIMQKGFVDVNQIKDLVESEKLKIRTLMPLTITIVREDYLHDKESLILESVNDKNQEELPLGFFSLQIQSLSESENFWLDSGEFILDIKTR